MSQPAYGNSPQNPQPKRLVRDPNDKWVGGVCSGLGHYFGLDPNLVRILFALVAAFGGASLVVYVVLWIVMPAA